MKALRFALIFVAVFVAWIAGVYFWLRQPYQGFRKDVFIDIEHGTGTRSIAETLEQTGVISHAWQFLAVRIIRPYASLQAGEYHFDHAASVFQVFDRIAHGDVYHFDFTAPEGSNVFDIARLLEEQDIMHADDFLRAAMNTAMIQDLSPKAKSLEGFLFPSTYRMTHAMKAVDLCRMMTEEFRKRWKKLSDSPRDVNAMVTLASLIEKETGAADERPLIASVFTNRLSQGMKLECDPTTIYAALLEHRYKGVIHRSDLDSKNVYNTYQHEGLPPGPIANPGAGALEAALHPADTKFIFFVAKPEGGRHQFSTTLAQHEQAVREYRAGAHATVASKPAR